ncbi:hypothetical protein VULLAG_LOCUS22948 [Vulpes lagopus]
MNLKLDIQNGCARLG